MKTIEDVIGESFKRDTSQCHYYCTEEMQAACDTPVGLCDNVDEPKLELVEDMEPRHWSDKLFDPETAKCVTVWIVAITGGLAFWVILLNVLRWLSGGR